MSRGSESITELRKICQESRYENEGGMPWFERNFYRRISIYFTKIFLKIGISANKVTLLSLFVALLGGLFLIFANNIPYWIISALFLVLYLILDRVDGEIARYNQLPSKFGRYFDFMVGSTVHPYTVICITFGAYNALHDSIIFIFGFLAVSLELLHGISSLDLYRIRISYGVDGLPNKSKNINTTKSSIEKVYGLVKKIGSFLGPGALMYPILIATCLDIFFAPVSINIPIIGLFTINTRYAFLIVYGVGKLSSFILKTYSLHEKEFGSKHH